MVFCRFMLTKTDLDRGRDFLLCPFTSFKPVDENTSVNQIHQTSILEKNDDCLICTQKSFHSFVTINVVFLDGGGETGRISKISSEMFKKKKSYIIFNSRQGFRET